MEKSKPIEAGCLALVIKSCDWGNQDTFLLNKIVLVVNWLEKYERKIGDDIHVVMNAWVISFEDVEYIMNGKCLIRIDDPDIQNQIEAEASNDKAATIKPSI